MTFTNGNSTKFFYSAEGEKRRAVHTTGGTTTQVDYCGNIVYEAGVQKYLLHDEGYYDLAGGSYHYYLKDHLGNNRVVISQNGSVEQTTHYYPYGGTFASTTTGQPYKYNGKEYNTHNGINWYDYGARHYDPAIARWTTQDPLAEKYYSWNQYNYCGANPIIRIDSEGKFWETAWDAASLTMGLKSLMNNIRQGNVGAAIADGAGVLLDAAAVATPFVPGGASAAISAARVADKVDDIVDAGKGLKNADDAVEVSQTSYFTSSNFRKNLGKLTGGEVKGADAHHIFPQVFEAEFRNAGINIHDPQYGVWIESHQHRKEAKAYNVEWQKFLEGSKTKEEIIEKAKELAEQYKYELNIKE